MRLFTYELPLLSSTGVMNLWPSKPSSVFFHGLVKRSIKIKNILFTIYQSKFLNK